MQSLRKVWTVPVMYRKANTYTQPQINTLSYQLKDMGHK